MPEFGESYEVEQSIDKKESLIDSLFEISESLAAKGDFLQVISYIYNINYFYK